MSVSIVTLMSVVTSLTLATPPIAVVKHWSTAVSQGNTAKLACKANTGTEISQCKWMNKRRGLEYHSEDITSSRDNEVVSLGKTPGSRLNNMCFFTINNVNYDHNGDWECSLYADCEEGGARTEDVDTFFDGRRRKRQVLDRRCKAADCNSDSFCDNQASEDVKVGVFSQDDIGVVGAQDVYHANVGNEASLTVRVNEEFTYCRISKGRDQIVEIAGSGRGDQCRDMPGRTGGRVCARVTRGVPSCILNIDRVEANMEGVWTFSIDREVRNRNISQTVELEVVMVELPTAVYLQYEDQQVGNDSLVTMMITL